MGASQLSTLSVLSAILHSESIPINPRQQISLVVWSYGVWYTFKMMGILVLPCRSRAFECSSFSLIAAYHGCCLILETLRGAIPGWFSLVLIYLLLCLLRHTLPCETAGSGTCLSMSLRAVCVSLQIMGFSDWFRLFLGILLSTLLVNLPPKTQVRTSTYYVPSNWKFQDSICPCWKCNSIVYDSLKLMENQQTGHVPGQDANVDLPYFLDLKGALLVGSPWPCFCYVLTEAYCQFISTISQPSHWHYSLVETCIMWRFSLCKN